MRDIIMLKGDFVIPICLIGDFYSRTGLLDDFLDIDNDISTNMDNIDIFFFSSSIVNDSIKIMMALSYLWSQLQVNRIADLTRKAAGVYCLSASVYCITSQLPPPTTPPPPPPPPPPRPPPTPSGYTLPGWLSLTPSP